MPQSSLPRPPHPLAEYETMPLPELTPGQLDAIVDTHSLELDGPITRMKSSGVVHSLWALGRTMVLRVPKRETMCLGDHRCEVVAIPMARAAGVRTPALILFDESEALLDVPYTVVERVHGWDLANEPRDHDVYLEVGRQLAELHHTDAVLEGHDWLRHSGDPPAEAFFEDVVAAGMLHGEGVEWCQRLCDQLDKVIDVHPTAPRSFVHGDVKPDNLMVDEAGAAYVIDWGDAGFGDPAYDFQSMPLRSVMRMLEGYRAVTEADPSLEARIVRRAVARSLSNMRRAPLRGPSWYRPVAANIVDLLTFAADEPETWSRWTSGS